jgi:hypothetical protein
VATSRSRSSFFHHQIEAAGLHEIIVLAVLILLSGSHDPVNRDQPEKRLAGLDRSAAAVRLVDQRASAVIVKPRQAVPVVVRGFESRLLGIVEVVFWIAVENEAVCLDDGMTGIVSNHCKLGYSSHSPFLFAFFCVS